MATQEKLLKSLQNLKKLSNHTSKDGNQKKEKAHLCHIVTESISNPTIQIASSFSELLGVTLDILFRLCDDQESNIRMIAEESINRIIRALSHNHIAKVQIEIYKVIKQNGSSKILRAALIRFAQLAHLIKPHKRKPYIASLFPILIRISTREEEQIHETLSNCLSRIMESLGLFTTDSDIKGLIKGFLNNTIHSSPAIRRSSAACLYSICSHCKSSEFFTLYVISHTLELFIPVHEIHDSNIILGAMNVFKILLPLIKEMHFEKLDNLQKKFNVNDKLIQIYELCLYYLKFDHNIVNACLETLNVLLQNATLEFEKALTNPDGFKQSTLSVQSLSSLFNIKSPSQLSIATNVTLEDSSLAEKDLTDTFQTDIQKWIDESKLTVVNFNTGVATFNKYDPRADFVDGTDSFRKTTKFETDNSFSDFDTPSITKSGSVEDYLERLSKSSNSSEKSFSRADEDKSIDVSESTNLLEIDIGDLFEKDVPLIYCTRLITKLFLLNGTPGEYIKDKYSRVSVKSLALNCITSIIELYPKALLQYLDKNCKKEKLDEKLSYQLMSDILLFANHPDPQLRGNVRLLISKFIKIIISKSFGNYKSWLQENSTAEISCLYLENLVTLYKQGLQDESSHCTKQTLVGLGECLNIILESGNCETFSEVLEMLPVVAKNPYWLVKVTLCDVISNLPYIIIHAISGNNSFQNKVIHNILFELLSENDQRVRTSAANAIVKIVPFLYFPEFKLQETIITAKAMDYKNKYLSNMCDKSLEINLNRTQFKENLPFPFNQIDDVTDQDLECALSKIISHMHFTLLPSHSKYLINGCIEALALLSKTYSCVCYPKAWNCVRNQRNKPETNINLHCELLDLCVCYLSSNIAIYDLKFHSNILNLSSNLYAASALSSLKLIVEEREELKLWDVFDMPVYAEISRDFLNHIMRLLNIFNHILDNVNPQSLQSKTVLPNLPSANNISPIKRRKSDLDKNFLYSVKNKDEKVDKKDLAKKDYMGSFVHLPHYVKIYESLKTSYRNYKVSLENESSEAFLILLHSVLQALSILLEIGTFEEFGNIAEDLLEYLSSIFIVEPTCSVHCVRQVLKAVFGTNLTTNISEFLETTLKENNENFDSDTTGFYNNLFQLPYQEISSSINSLRKTEKLECDGDSTVMGYLHRKNIKKINLASKGSDKILVNYIRMFEPVVIKSLRQYTTTTDVHFQGAVLQLLTQLVQLRVNYCLLDSDQIFIGFVLKQFEYIEEGQVKYSNQLIPKIFQFLVQLSYSKQHSKNIIEIPKIIQLCDGLMASGQSPLTHCVTALKPVVEDIFLIRNKVNTTDTKELETMREVMFSMLLKLAEYHEVIDLIVLILDDSKYCSDTNKWLRWSRQVFTCILNMLKHDKYKFFDMESFVSLRRLIFFFNPAVFDSIDDLLNLLFQRPPNIDDKIDNFICWLGKILILILILSSVKEEVLLEKISEGKKSFCPLSVFENITITPDPLNVTSNKCFFVNVTPDVLFIKYIFRTLKLIMQKCIQHASQTENKFFVQEISMFLMFCIHNFQSGSHCKTSNTLISIINKRVLSDDLSLELINSYFKKLVIFYPSLTFQWNYLLTLFNYNDRDYWSSILHSPSNSRLDKKNANLNAEIVKTGSVIVMCDFLNENSECNDDISWMLDNYINLLIELYNEVPVYEFLTFVNRDIRRSKVLLDSIARNSLDIVDPVFKMNLLKCLENVHPNQSGNLLSLLLPKMLNIKEMSLLRTVTKLAARQIELLLTMSMEDVIVQLKKQDLISIMTYYSTSDNEAIRYEALIGLLNKLASQYYDLSPFKMNQRRSVDPDYIKTLKIDKTWYLSQIKCKLSSSNLGKQSAEVLNVLNYEEIVSITHEEVFNKAILKNCFDYGVDILNSELVSAKEQILRPSEEVMFAEIRDILRIYLVKEDENIANLVDFEKSLNFINKSLLTSNKILFTKISNLISSVTTYLKYLDSYSFFTPDEKCLNYLINFVILSLELVVCMIEKEKSNPNVHLIDLAVNCANLVFKNTQIFNVLSVDTHVLRICSAVNSIYKIVDFLLLNFEPLPSCENYPFSCYTQENVEIVSCQKACCQLSTLIYWIYNCYNSYHSIPLFLRSSIKNVVISLSRLPVFYSYASIPQKVWGLNWHAELSGVYSTQASLLPVDILQDCQILKEYIYRLTLLGWSTRQQFEETWMCFLSVLCNTPPDDSTLEEINELSYLASLAAKAINSLLIKTLYISVPGKTNGSKLMHVPRDEPISCDKISLKKLKNIQLNIVRKFNDNESLNFDEKNKIHSIFLKPNFEKYLDCYSYCQLSVKFFLIATKSKEIVENCPAWQMYKKRTEILQNSGLDVNSCLQFLLDYYTQVLRLEALKSLPLLHEIVRSIVIISDLFEDKQQFAWMLDIFLELMKSHSCEDELLHQYLIVGISKAIAILNPELEFYENVKKYLVIYLKSSFLPTRIASLYSLLYLIEGCVLSNIHIGKISEELQLILPHTIEYIQEHLDENFSLLQKSQEHCFLVWALAFYIIENISHVHFEPNFVPNVIQNALAILHRQKVPSVVHDSILKGLERLIVINGEIRQTYQKPIVKLALAKMKADNPTIAILGIQLLLSYIYTDCTELIETRASSTIVQTNPENLIDVIEKISFVFDYIRKAYLFEAETICYVLPSILNDFFTPADILTKVIGEFLALQQPHPTLLSRVVFSLFESAIKQDQLQLIQDWVVFSLSNFTQNFSVGMATWYLTCFFISASTNVWLRSLFPYIQTRMQRYEYEDKKMFCIAGANFYQNLSEDKQREAFKKTFNAVKDDPDMPFNSLLNSL